MKEVIMNSKSPKQYALEIVTQIKNNTNAIWELETTNKVAVDIQNEAEAIEAHATLVAEALE